jgi:hypothetical protein
MDQRLFADHVRRHRQSFIAVAAIAAGIWFGASFDPDGAHWAMAASLMVTFVAGPLRTFQALAPLEVQFLPISRRSIWRTGWWLSVVVAIGVATTGKVIGLAAAHLLSDQPSMTIDMVWLSTTYDLAQAGALMIIVRAMLVLPTLQPTIWPRISRLLLTVAIILVMAATLLWPFLVFHLLPVRWQQLNAAAFGVIALGLALTALNYVMTPARIGMPGKRATQAAWRTSKRWTPGFDRVNGLRKLVFETWKAAVFTQVGVPLFIIGSMAAVNAVMHGDAGGWLLEPRDLGLLPFDGNMKSSNPSSMFVLYFLGNAGLVWPFAMIGHQDVVQFMLRHLRTLPLGTRSLNTLMLALPLVSWVNLWLVLLVFHFAVGGGPVVSLRLGEWLALIGISALIRAMFLRWRSYLWPGALGAVVFGISLFVAKLALGALPAIAATTGGICLLFAWALNHDTLMRSRLAYSRVQVSPQIAALQPEA